METIPRSIPSVSSQSTQPPSKTSRALPRLLLIILAIAAVPLGFTARRITWDATQSLRHSEDLCNGWGWGQRALRYGFVHLYDDVIHNRPDGDYTLDYAPLRLAVMTAWAHWTNVHADGLHGWRDDYAFTAPLLHFNTFMALLSAIAIFALVRHWSPPSPGASPSFAKPLAAALLFWLNPALLLNAHAWPQWDVWLIPFFLFALLAASSNRWLVAGALLGIGAMFKGQILFAAPLLILWPLFRKDWRSALDVLLAFLATVALIAAPWLIGHGAVPVSLFMAITWFIVHHRRWRRWHWRAVLLATVIGLFLCPLLFNGSMAWFKIGFCYGAEKFGDMNLGAENLAALLYRNFNLHCKNIIFTLHCPPFQTHFAITVQQSLAAIFVLFLVLISKAAARHAIAHSPRFLVAAVMPWLLLFAVMTQMHERYLVWAACLSALWVAAGWRTTCLHLLITALSFLIMAKAMAASSTTGWPALSNVIQPAIPALAWIVLAATLTALYFALRSSNTRTATPEQSTARPRRSATPVLS